MNKQSYCVFVWQSVPSWFARYVDEDIMVPRRDHPRDLPILAKVIDLEVEAQSELGAALAALDVMWRSHCARLKGPGALFVQRPPLDRRDVIDGLEPLGPAEWRYSTAIDTFDLEVLR